MRSFSLHFKEKQQDRTNTGDHHHTSANEEAAREEDNTKRTKTKCENLAIV